jgi:hypothetical protein
MSIDQQPELIALQDAVEQFDIGIATLHRYLAAGKLQRYRKGFDPRTYVDCGELGELLQPATERSFLAELPIRQDSPLLGRLVRTLQERYPKRSWDLAGWGSYALPEGHRTHGYTVFKYRAHRQKDVLQELSAVLDDLDPASKQVERNRIFLKENPFSA